MAFITADRVLDSSTSTGTGAFVVSGTPAAGYRTFSAVMSVNDTCYYSIQGQTTSEWEVGLGTYSSANTLTRTTVYSSSNAGAAVTFSAGTKNVFITMAASKSPQLDPSGNVTALGTPASITLTNATSLPLATGVTGTLSANNGGSLAWQSVQTGNFTAVAGNAYPVNTTSGAVTVTLPASPTAGQLVQITDYSGKWSINNVTVSPNGNKINGSTSSATISASRGSVAIVYIDATQGWISYSDVASPILGQTYSANYLIVGGGGGGGNNWGGGGGAGGVVPGSIVLTSSVTYRFIIGAGGVNSINGNSTTGFGLTALGGGAGSEAALTNGFSGASGGGAGGGSGVASIGGSRTLGQGYQGGNVPNTTNASGGGGGGGGAVGGNSAASSVGAGGYGYVSTITGTAAYYGGGGGGGGLGGGGAGGSGGGAAGSSTSTPPTAATANTGGGGGGGSATTGGQAGSTGGSGVVFISVPTANYSGVTTGSPTVTTSGSNTIIKFTASGSYTA